MVSDVCWLVDLGCHGCTYARVIHLSGLRLHLTSLISMNLCLKEQICHALLHVYFRASFWDETRQIVTKKPSPASSSDSKTPH